MANYVKGVGNPHSKLLILGEAPGAVEDETGIPFSGPSGQLLDEMLESLGTTREEFWLTNVYKFRPPNNNILKIGEVCNPEEQKEKLWKEIEFVNPNCILCLGNTAFSVIKGHGGILKWRGSILTSKYGDRKIIGTIHPSNIVRSNEGSYWQDRKQYPYIWKSIMIHDIRRAIEQSKFSGLNLPPRYVTICRDSMQLVRFLNENKNLSKMSCDIESHNCVPICMGISFSKYESMVIPFLNIITASNPIGIPISDQSYIWQLLDKLLKEKKIIGQNFKYDQDKLEMVGFSFLPERPIYSDTLLKAHTINPELPSKRMEMLQSLWTELPYHKDEGKEFNPKKDKIEKLYHYCGLDSISTFETDEEMEKDLVEMSDTHHLDMKSFYYDYIMRLHQIYLDMENVGFRVDKSAKEFLKVKYQINHDLIQARFSAYLPGWNIKGKKCHQDHSVNVAAHGQIKSLIYGHLNLPIRTVRGKVKADEDTIVQLLNNVRMTDESRGILTDIIEDRRTRKTLGTYVLAKADYDGRIRGSYRITGTETGRSSTAILKQPLRPSKSGHAFQTLTKHGTVGADIRTIYIPDCGFVFAQFDLSQAEPRIVACLSKDIQLLQAFTSGKVDIHRRTAALVLDLTNGLDLSENYNEIADSLGKDSGERFLGKKSRNGGNYDMGKGELALNIATDAKRFGINVSVSEWRAGKMLENFHRESPNIRRVFHKEVQEAINSSRVLINPFGRVRTFFERLEKKTYGEGYAQIPQSTVADKIKHSMIDIRKEMTDAKWMLLGEGHDSLLFQFPENEVIDRAKTIKGIMEAEIDFSLCTLKRGVLKIPVDVEIGRKNYREMERLRL